MNNYLLIALNVFIFIVTGIVSCNTSASIVLSPEIYTGVWKVLVLFSLPFISLLLVWFLCPINTELD